MLNYGMAVMKLKELALILTLLSVAGCSLIPGGQLAAQPSFKAVYSFKLLLRIIEPIGGAFSNQPFMPPSEWP